MANIEDGKLYHILYADEVRFSSLAAQIYGKVTENMTEEEQFADVNTATTAFDIKVAQHERESSTNKVARQSAYYTLRDALYFKILDELNIDPAKPEDFVPDIVDGDIHVLSGNMKISGSSVIAPMMEMMQKILPQIKKNPSLFGLKDNKEMHKQWGNVKSMIDILPGIPMPTVFRLFTSNNEVISGPIDDLSARLNMSNMMWLFKGQLPFSWRVVGYLYPVKNCELLADDFLSMIEKGLSDFSSNFMPHSSAIMFPLLIMR